MNQTIANILGASVVTGGLLFWAFIIWQLTEGVIWRFTRHQILLTNEEIRDLESRCHYGVLTNDQASLFVAELANNRGFHYTRFELNRATQQLWIK